MLQRKAHGVSQYKVGYFSRKHKLHWSSAKLVLALARDYRHANRLAKTLRYKKIRPRSDKVVSF
jgi:hypothetical protein